MQEKGKFLLIVSRNRYRSYNYNTSVLTSPTLSGQYSGERAFITTRNSKAAAGSGGADIVYVEENNVGWVAFFHGWVSVSDCYVRRPMSVAELTFGADGVTPNLARQGSGSTPRC